MQPPIESELLPQSQWAEPNIEMFQDQDLLNYTLDGTIAFHGMDSIGGVVLGFRIVQFALQLASESKAVDRQNIRILSAFPGPGAQDAFEYLTRCVSQDRFQCDITLNHPDVQKGFKGCFYFKISIGEKVFELSPVVGHPPESFFSAGREAFKDDANNADKLLWRQEKFKLANTLLSLPANQCIRLLDA